MIVNWFLLHKIAFKFPPFSFSLSGEIMVVPTFLRNTFRKIHSQWIKKTEKRLRTFWQLPFDVERRKNYQLKLVFTINQNLALISSNSLLVPFRCLLLLSLCDIQFQSFQRKSQTRKIVSCDIVLNFDLSWLSANETLKWVWPRELKTAQAMQLSTKTFLSLWEMMINDILIAIKRCSPTQFIIIPGVP